MKTTLAFAFAWILLMLSGSALVIAIQHVMEWYVCVPAVAISMALVCAANLVNRFISRNSGKVE